MELSTPSRPATHERARPTSGFYRMQQHLAPYIFVAPFILLFAAFSLWPIIKSVILAFYATSGPKSQVYVGTANFRFLLSDPDFHTAVKNTVIYAAWSTFLQLPLALGLAMLLSQKWLRGRNFWRLAFFFPNLLGTVFVGVLFSVLFVPQYGLVNKALNALTFGAVALDTRWLSDPGNVMPALVMTSLWMYVGFNMIYFLAALQGVDKELYEATQVDGANAWQQFWAVTVPGIRPVAVFVLVTSTIGSFQLFELPYILLGNSAGPDNSGLTIVMYLYNTGFISGDLGYASAVGWTLALAMLCISLIQIRLTGAMKQ
jgi:ABC-type sugar transport system permease subunit